MITLNGSHVHSARLTRPLSGAWLAELDVDVADPPSGAATIALEGGGTLAGTVVRGGDFTERVTVQVAGGRGGLAKVLPSKWYRSVTLRTLIVDALFAAGERLAATSDASFLSTRVPAWNRRNGKLAAHLDELVARVAGAVWRVLADGTIWFGIPAWTAREVLFDTYEDDAVTRRLLIATDDLAIDAGVSVGERKITRVEYSFEGARTRTVLWYA